VRTDVCAALNLPAETPTGFRILGQLQRGVDSARETEITVSASWSVDDEEYEIGKCAIQLVPASLAQRPYGESLFPAQTKLLHRESIYGSGPPIEEPGAETLHLLKQYLPTPGSVLDVGCGAGAYGPALMEAGHEWTGLEVNSYCWEILERRNLPFRKTGETASAFPVRPAEFDYAICVEVLEHIRQVDGFLSEVSRAIRGRALFSVPNIEVIPYFHAWQVVPWHLLEADHKNFFTRGSLQALLKKYFAHVEVFSYAEHPLPTPDGVPLHVHLFAIATK
jgi:SAM-dependent methyltransferase